MMHQSKPNDVWSIGAAYEQYVGRGGQGPAPVYTMTLSEDRRVALREEIRANLPIVMDGSIHLIARAWAIRGVLGL
jgi:hypothetical protein